MQDFLWDSFCNADSVGVNALDVMTGAKFVGLKLTDDQIQGVLDHYHEPGNRSEGDEEVKDMIADATDCSDGDKLYQWLVWAVGNQTADDLLEDWK